VSKASSGVPEEGEPACGGRGRRAKWHMCGTASFRRLPLKLSKLSMDQGEMKSG
jgi:hypothetical protein